MDKPSARPQLLAQVRKDLRRCLAVSWLYATRGNLCFLGMCLVMSSAAESQAVSWCLEPLQESPATKARDSTLASQTSAARRRSPQTPSFLKIAILHSDVFRWTTQVVIKMVVRPIAKLSQDAGYI